MDLLIVDDHELFRDALAGMLRQAISGSRIAVAGCAQDALNVAEQVEPDFVFLDFNLPGPNGLEVARCLLEMYPDVSIICLSVRVDQGLIQELYASGVRGYVLKDEEFDVLVEAFRAVQAGQRYLSPRLQGQVELPEMKRPGTKPLSGFMSLTSRQRDILARLASGVCAREISKETGLSTKTIDAHRRRIQQRLAVDSIAELTRVAVREGLVGLDGDLWCGQGPLPERSSG